MSADFISREYRSGQSLAETFAESDLIVQVRIFKEIAKESDYCILGFCDGLAES